MKKLFLALMLVLTAVSSFAQERYKPQDFAFVGQQHNQYLEDIYNYWVSNNIKGPGIIDKTQQYLNQRVAQSSMPAEAKTIAIGNIEKNKRAFGTLKNLYPGVDPKTLSAAEKSYLDQLYQIVIKEEIPVATMTQQVSSLETKISNDMSLNNTQLAILFSATSTAKSSLSYWAGNSQKWSTYGGSQAAKAMGPGDGVGAADVGGAVGAAVTTWMANAVPGAGQIAYGGAIVTGAVAASAAKAVENLINSWF